jgi:L-threonylcarbamoyladenylate synthase
MASVSLTELISGARSGKFVVSFPTDTVPALAVRPDCSDRIFAVKQRSLTKPLILMGASADDLWRYVSGTQAERNMWQQVADQHWPGALTLVLPASDRLPIEMNPHDSTTIGIRVPNHAIARHILTETGPLATTSANLSGQAPLLTASEINAQFPDVLLLSPTDLKNLARKLQFDKTANPEAGTRVPSTVVKWESGNWQILRQGQIVL